MILTKRMKVFFWSLIFGCLTIWVVALLISMDGCAPADPARVPSPVENGAHMAPGQSGQGCSGGFDQFGCCKSAKHPCSKYRSLPSTDDGHSVHEMIDKAHAIRNRTRGGELK